MYEELLHVNIYMFIPMMKKGQIFLLIFSLTYLILLLFINLRK